MKAKFNRIANQIENELMNATQSIKIAIAWFTNENLFETLIILLNKGVKIEIVTINDRINNHENGLDFNNFISKGGFFFFSELLGTMHHKFVIIDESKLISGSYNWTYNAEYRNQENIITIENRELLESFLNEFERLKTNSILQENIISIKPEATLDIITDKYRKDDLIYKSVDEEKKGNLYKSIETLKIAKKILNSDNKSIEKRIVEIKEKIKNPRFYYHIEDGQFSIDFEANYLIGNEGDIIKVSTDRSDDLEDVYILFIDGNNVECIGNIEREFPKSEQEHNELKELMYE